MLISQADIVMWLPDNSQQRIVPFSKGKSSNRSSSSIVTLSSGFLLLAALSPMAQRKWCRMPSQALSTPETS